MIVTIVRQTLSVTRQQAIAATSATDSIRLFFEIPSRKLGRLRDPSPQAQTFSCSLHGRDFFFEIPSRYSATCMQRTSFHAHQGLRMCLLDPFTDAAAFLKIPSMQKGRFSRSLTAAGIPSTVSGYYTRLTELLPSRKLGHTNQGLCSSDKTHRYRDRHCENSPSRPTSVLHCFPLIASPYCFPLSIWGVFEILHGSWGAFRDPFTERRPNLSI